MFKKFCSIFIISLLWVTQAQAENPVILLQTNQGEIKLELYPEKAPITVKNFVDYVNSGFYDGTIFHRTIAGFMIQGGGFTEDMQQKPTKDAIKNESDNGLSNAQGTIAMARTRHPDSATSQFYINSVNNRNLDNRPGRPGYAVFGKVTEGLELVVKISRSQTERKLGHMNVPKQAVVIEKAVLLNP